MPGRVILLLLLLSAGLKAQEGTLAGNLQERIISFDGGGILLDSLPLFSGSVAIFHAASGTRVDSANYTVVAGFISWRKGFSLAQGTRLLARYRLLPRAWQVGYAPAFSVRRDSGGRYFLSGVREDDPFSLASEFRRIGYSGGFMRGLSLGNRQDLVLNSRLNLQISGEIAPGFFIRAAVTDENLPVQATGNTLQWQDFDRVYLSLEKDGFRFTAGDFELESRGTRFNDYFRKVQGLQLHFQHEKGNRETAVNTSFSRGQFHRQVLDVREGNQGPYRLTSPAGPTFTILLAGTEKVFVNGKRAVRGTSGDYVIDYNRGEVTFTPNQLIARETRVVVEFEYMVTNRNRSVLGFRHQARGQRTTYFLQGLAQVDSKVSQIYRQLEQTHLEALVSSVAQEGKTNLPGWQSADGTPPGSIHYARRDTLLACGKRDTFFVFQPGSGPFVVRFGIPASGKGDYVLDVQGSANERIFTWLAPDPLTCESRGQYAPIVPVDLPQALQLLGMGQETQLAQGLIWHTEMGLSRQIPNRFAPGGGGNRIGLASWNALRWTDSTQNKRMVREVSLSHEFIHKNYASLEPLRRPDFLREWGLTGLLGKEELTRADEQVVSLQLGWRQIQRWGGEYRLEHYLRRGQFSGLRHQATLAANWKSTSISGHLAQVLARNMGDRIAFIRPALTFRTFLPGQKPWSLESSVEGERNARQSNPAGRLNAGSFAFHQVRFSIKSPETVRNPLYLDLQSRTDLEARGEGFGLAFRARSLKAGGSFQVGKQFTLRHLWQYRKLEHADRGISNGRSGGVMLGQLQGEGTLFRGLLRGQMGYEKGSGQEPRLEFTFIQVSPGMGSHIWLDSLFNRDGLIQQEEMMPAPFPDQADFIRVNTLGNQYLPARFLHVHQSITVDPSRWRDKLPAGLTRWQWQSTWRVDRKTADDTGLAAFNPFSFREDDPNLLSMQLQQKNVLFINRGHKIWDLQLGNSRQFQKWLQLAGSESRGQSEIFARWRWNPHPQWQCRSELGQGRQHQLAQRFVEKNYRMRMLRSLLAALYLPSPSLRTGLTLATSTGTPESGGEGTGYFEKWDLNWTAAWSARAGQSLQGSISRITIQYDGPMNTPAAYSLLQGLQVGNNWQWELQFEKVLGRNLRLHCRYQGRKGSRGPVYHLGNIQLGASF